MKRRIFTFVSALSLIAALGSALAWVASYPGGILYTSSIAGTGYIVTGHRGWLCVYQRRPLISIRSPSAKVWRKVVGFEIGVLQLPPGQGTDRELRVHFAYPLFLAVFLPSVWVVLCWRRRVRARRLRLCPSCGYDMRASEGRCPECGAPIPASHNNAMNLAGQSNDVRSSPQSR